MNSFPLSSDHLAMLARADSPTVANVIELFDVRPRVAGYTHATLKALYPELPPAVGYAVTATFRSAYPPSSQDAYGGMLQLIADAQAIPAPRIVVFQDLDEPPAAATYGEVMVTTFRAFGFVGLITSGAARDIEQVRALRFPCWASGVIVSHGYNHILAGNVPVTVGGLQVNPGDLLHADANGIVSIPSTIAVGVAELCEPFMRAESIVLDYLRKPNPTLEGYRHAQGRMREALAELRQRAQTLVSGKS
ncbi:MAG: acyltransferase [Candidatus Roseilinea sp.]|nr:MAG: acyltransferase [Candidatus Roseilinea sp.]